MNADIGAHMEKTSIASSIVFNQKNTSNKTSKQSFLSLTSEERRLDLIKEKQRKTKNDERAKFTRLMTLINDNNQMLKDVNSIEEERKHHAKKDIGLSEENLDKMKMTIGTALSKHIK